MFVFGEACMLSESVSRHVSYLYVFCLLCCETSAFFPSQADISQHEKKKRSKRMKRSGRDFRLYGDWNLHYKNQNIVHLSIVVWNTLYSSQIYYCMFEWTRTSCGYFFVSFAAFMLCWNFDCDCNRFEAF